MEVQAHALEEIVTRGQSCLVGKLMIVRIVGKDTIKTTGMKTNRYHLLQGSGGKSVFGGI